MQKACLIIDARFEPGSALRLRNQLHAENGSKYPLLPYFQGPSHSSSRLQSAQGSHVHVSQVAQPLYHAAGMSLTAHQEQYTGPSYGTAAAHAYPPAHGHLPEYQQSSSFHPAHAAPGNLLQERTSLQHPATSPYGTQPALPMQQSWQPVQEALPHQHMQSSEVYPWG